MPIDQDWYDDLGEGWWDPTGPVAALHEFNDLRVPYFAEQVRRHAPPPTPTRRVLDIGAGGGLLADALAREGMDVVALDRSARSLRIAADRRSADCTTADAAHLPFPDGTFHAVVCSEVLGHVADPEVVLAECARVLRRRGLLLFSTPNRTWYARLALVTLPGWAPHDVHEYGALIRPGELTRMAARLGLHVQELHGVALRRGAWRAAWGRARRRRTGGYRLSTNRRLSYIGWARRR